ncbi:MAG TPA: sugar nucleotide-binding protein [Kofleriaceae bacterium]|nr:sugar nucleotide-binding protein [Kofleriaceae bacterium]
MSVFLFGATSMLGWSILRAAGPEEPTAFRNALTKAEVEGISAGIDLDDEPSVRELFAREKPRLIINCAGVCDVGTCEQSPDFAHVVNVEGTRVLLAHAPPDARIVHCSSDHVFSGDGGPYDESTPTDPISVYGRTRVEAEQLVLARPNTLVIRAGLWIGPSSTGRIGHLDWLRDRTKRGLPMTIVADEHRSAVWAEDAARRVWELARSSITGVRHIVASRIVSRPELARFLDEKFGIGAKFDTETRAQRWERAATPHLGKVSLVTRFTDALAAPLPPVVPA